MAASAATQGPPRWFMAIMPITTFCLGVWQVRRLQWKENLIKQVNERLALPPAPVPENLRELRTPEYEFRRVELEGVFDHEHEIRVAPRTFNGVPGAHVITPLTLMSGKRLLVNRGFVPREALDPSKRPEGQVEGTVHVMAMPRQMDFPPNAWVPNNQPELGIWYWADAPMLALHTNSEPVVVDALAEPPNPGGLPIGGQTTAHFRNNHMQYAVTWFLLSAASTVLMFVKR